MWRRLPMNHHLQPSRWYCLPRRLSHSTSGGSGSSSQTKTNIQLTAGGVFVLFVGSAISARVLYGQLVGGGAAAGTKGGSSTLRPDQTHVLIRTPSVVGTPNVIQQSQTSTELRQVDASKFYAFVQEQRLMLEEEAHKVRKDASNILTKELEEAFSGPHERVPSFSSWYLSYPTTYKFLSLATSSALKHAVSFQKESTLAARVIEDLQNHVLLKYDAIILRPATTDPRIQLAMERAVVKLFEGYKESIHKLDSSLASFVSAQAEPYVGKSRPNVVLQLDYSKQISKLQHIPIQYEKTPTVTLVAVGTAAGKFTSTGAGFTATKALTAKILSPYAGKAAGSALAGKTASGATAGAILGGPVAGIAGAIAGAAVGIGIDMTVNAGLSLMQRPALEKDLHDCINATQHEWENRLVEELDRVHAIWFDHAMAALSVKPDNHDKGHAVTANPPPEVHVFVVEGEDVSSTQSKESSQ